jgi:TM2 domain-containing membrane protein YozV
VNTQPDGQRGSGWIAALTALLFPGAGHLYLGRRGRALFFAAIVLTCLVLGTTLDGKLFTTFDSPFGILRTVASMSVGLPYFVLRFLLGYEGDVRSVGFEYGSAFLITAGLMNLLLVLDCWDGGRAGAKARDEGDAP